jgi:hypothetical protein
MKEEKRRIQQGATEDNKETVRIRVYPEELEIVNNYRSLYNEAIELGQNPKDVKHGWVKSKEASLFIKNPNFNGELDKQKEFTDNLIKSLKEHSPKYDKIKREKQKEGHLLVIDPADVHIGKLCSALEVDNSYDSQIAVQRVLDGVYGILQKSNGFNIDKINFIGGNDILHIDTPSRTTTSGTPQDTSGMWYENFLMAKRLYVEVLEMLISIADVHFTFNPSNHDYTNGFFLADVIKTHFRDCKNITFDCSISHRKYYNYGNSLIGTTHGDGAKNTDLGSLMSVEAKDYWADSEHRYFYTHHVHHKTSKDFINVTVESLRSPSPADSWHHRNGYINSPAIEGFIHHKTNGQVARLTHYF